VIETAKFPFSGEFNTQVLAVLLKDKSFIPRKRHILKHSYFDNPSFAGLCKIILDFYDKYNIVPTEESLKELIVDKEDSRLYEVVLKKVKAADVSNGSFIEDTITDWCTQQALRISHYLMTDLIKNKEYDKILPMIEKALLSKQDNSMDGFALSNSFERIKNALSDDNRVYSKIATLIPGMDRVLRGGVSPGTLHMVFAGTKIGKSVVLNSHSHACALQGRKATHVTLEMDDEQVAVRSHMRLSGMSDEQLLSHEKQWGRSFNRLLSAGGDIYFKKFPSGQLTIPQLGTFLDQLWKIEGYATDLLVVDYLDLMKHSSGMQNEWLGQTELAVGLRGLAGELNIPVWTASQGGKDSGRKDTLDERDIKGSSGKSDTVDSQWALIRSREDMLAVPPRAKLKNTLLREGKLMGTTVPVIFDPNTMYIGDCADLGEIEEEIPF